MPKPNILWICTDQQRYDTIHALGNSFIKTPNLDNFCKEGVVFTQAFSQNPLCQPSRASFLTGRYPGTAGVRQNGQKYFPPHEKLITKTLSEIGYTCGLIGKLHIAAACGRIEERTDDGYSKFYWNHHPYPAKEWENADAYQKWLKEKGVNWQDIYKPGEDFKRTNVCAGVPEEYHQTTWCIEKAMEFIEEVSSPWCLSINLFDPHHPFDPPENYLSMYKPEDMPEPFYKEGELENKPFPQKIDHYGAYGGQGISFSSLSPFDRKRITAAYYGMITLIDKQVGRLLNYLKEKEDFENTVVIFMSDHGELLGDHGMYLKGPYFYEPSIRVPLIISYPQKFKRNLRCNALIELVDIVPTIYDILGMEKPECIQGKSLFNICTGEKEPDFHKASVYCEYYNTHVLYDSKKIYATMYRDENYKIVVYHRENEGELYNLKNDPYEFENLWNKKEYREKKNELIKKCFDRAVFTMDPCPERVATW